MPSFFCLCAGSEFLRIWECSRLIISLFMWCMDDVRMEEMGDARRILEWVFQKPEMANNVALDVDSEFLRV